MECHVCEQIRREFVCSPCLSRHLQAHRTALSHLSSERDLLIASASSSLGPLHAARARRAEYAERRGRLDDVQMWTRRVREECEEVREKIGERRGRVWEGRRRVGEGWGLLEGEEGRERRRSPTPTPPGGPPRTRVPPPPPAEQTHEEASTSTSKALRTLSVAHAALSDDLSRARQGLIHELVDVFAVVSVGGRPAAGVRAGTRGDWAIAGVVLPVPGDMQRRFGWEHTNAAVGYTVQFLGLVQFYLGVKCPFEVGWSGGRVGVGVLEIGVGSAGGGGEGSWVRWGRCPLYLPMSGEVQPTTMTNEPSTPSSTPSTPSSPLRSGSNTRTRTRTLSSSSSSHPSSSAAPNQPAPGTASFATALAMLSYNVAYLAWTQGAGAALGSVAGGAVLEVLWGVCCAGGLGERGHETGVNPSVLSFCRGLEGVVGVVEPGRMVVGRRKGERLEWPTRGFALDFRQLVQAQASVADGMVNHHHHSHHLLGVKDRDRRGREEAIEEEEEEEEWEVVEQ